MLFTDNILEHDMKRFEALLTTFYVVCCSIAQNVKNISVTSSFDQEKEELSYEIRNESPHSVVICNLWNECNPKGNSYVYTTGLKDGYGLDGCECLFLYSEGQFIYNPFILIKSNKSQSFRTVVKGASEKKPDIKIHIKYFEDSAEDSETYYMEKDVQY